MLFRSDVPVVVLAVPTKFEVGPTLDPHFRESGRQALAASIEGLGATLVDPTPAYSIDDFWARDTHWRPLGHVKAAQALAPVVRKILEQRAGGAGRGG